MALMLYHSRMHFRGFVASLSAFLFALVVLNGFVGSAIYYLGPRLLVRKESSGADDGVEPRFQRIARLWLISHVVLSGVLTGAILAHIAACFYY